jgi:glutaminyl-peptide cyclotransferase
MFRAYKAKILCCYFLFSSLFALPAVPRADYQPKWYGYRVLQTYPHDPSAFTQGLIYLDGRLFESTGLRGRSSLRMVDLRTGVVLRQLNLPAQFFGEGLTNWKTTLIQLTWTAHIGFVYRRRTFHLLRTFHYEGEGWGLTQDGANIIMSDGTSYLRFLDPSTFREVKRLTVSDHGAAVHDLNELEYIQGSIYANIWQTDRIAIISPDDGRVTGWIDLAGLRPITVSANPDAVLNGIAFDSAHDRLFVTGKLWPELFEIRLVPGKHSARK